MEMEGLLEPRKPDWNTTLEAHFKNGRTKPILGVVLHDTAGTGTHSDTLYLANPGDGRTVSVDFTVEQSGEIYKLNPQLTEYRTFHAGRSTHWREYSNGQINNVMVGIEMCQPETLANVRWSEAQVSSAAQLCAWLAFRFDFGTDAIVTHRQIITDGSRTDPRKFPFEGDGGFWHEFWRAFGRGGEFAE